MSKRPEIPLKEYLKPAREYFELHHDQDVSAGELSIYLKLKPNQTRWVITELKYEMPILHIADRVYHYTTTNLALLQKEYDKNQASIKQKSIKNNIIKRYINKI